MGAHTIRTEQIVLRPFCVFDHADLYVFLPQLDNDRFECCPGITLETSLAYLQNRISSAEYFAMEVNETGKVIGDNQCGDPEYRTKEVGDTVNRRFSPQGYLRCSGMLKARREASRGTGVEQKNVQH